MLFRSAVGIAACGGDVLVGATPGAPTSAAQETPGGSASDKPGDGGSRTTPVTDIKVGDCFNQSSETTEVASVEVVSCDSPHVYEVYNNSDIDEKKYSTAPTGDDLNTEISLACYDAFEMYVGVAYEESATYEVTSFYPTTGSWAQGDCTINCLITSKDGQPTTGSARDAKK